MEIENSRLDLAMSIVAKSRLERRMLKALFQRITEQQFVEFTKMQPPEWLKKQLSIHFD